MEVKEGDARQLPFPDESLDVVVSNFVVHEVNTAAEREKMMREMVRVLCRSQLWSGADLSGYGEHTGKHASS